MARSRQAGGYESSSVTATKRSEMAAPVVADVRRVTEGRLGPPGAPGTHQPDTSGTDDTDAGQGTDSEYADGHPDQDQHRREKAPTHAVAGQCTSTKLASPVGLTHLTQSTTEARCGCGT